MLATTDYIIMFALACPCKTNADLQLMQMAVHGTVHDISVVQPQEGCHTSVAGDACYEKVMRIMRTGIAENPEWYSPLTDSSSFEDFQRHLHGTPGPSGACPEPCAAQAPEAPAAGASYGGAEGSPELGAGLLRFAAPQDCHTSVEGDACFKEVMWAMRTGIVERPQWYPSLTKDSSFKDFQRLLHGDGSLPASRVCPRPCPERAPEVPRPTRVPAPAVQVAAPRSVSEAPAAGVSHSHARSIPWLDDDLWQSVDSKFREFRAPEPPLAMPTVECSRALQEERARRQFWRDTVGDHPNMHGERNQITTSPKYNISYVHNQKVGTHSFKKLFGCLDNRSHTVWMAYSGSTQNPRSQGPRELGQTFLFTFVRDPVGTAWSAYTEVSHREPSLVSAPCNAGNRRYEEYLTQITNGTLKDKTVLYSWPQSLKVDVLTALFRRQFDFVGRWETASADLRRLLMQSGVPMREISRCLADSFERGTQHDRDTVCDYQIEASHTHLGLDAETWPLLCKLYHVDMVCAGYPVPVHCS